MWLIYLRFDDNGQVKTYHVTAVRSQMQLLSEGRNDTLKIDGKVSRY